VLVFDHVVEDSVLRYDVIFLELSHLKGEGTVFLPNTGTDYQLTGHCVQKNGIIVYSCFVFHFIC